MAKQKDKSKSSGKQAQHAKHHPALFEHPLKLNFNDPLSELDNKKGERKMDAKIPPVKKSRTI